MKKTLLILSLLSLLTACSSGSLPQNSANTGTSPATEVAATPLPKEISFEEINLIHTPVAEALKINRAKPEFFISKEWGQLKVSWKINEKELAALPSNSMLQVWLLDNAKGEENSSISDDDSKNGISLFGEEENGKLPYPQLIGLLLPERDENNKARLRDGFYNFELVVRHNNQFEPFDKAMITLETNLPTAEPSSLQFNPRPGTPLWLGDLHGDNRIFPMERIPATTVVMYGDTEIDTLSPDDRAVSLNLVPNSQSIKLSRAYGKSWIIINYDKKPPIPEGAILEAWLIDHDSIGNEDKEIGAAYADWDSQPFAFSLGKLLEQPVDAKNPDARSYVSIMSADMPMPSFDEVVITLETDGNSGNYDPRPGILLLSESL